MHIYAEESFGPVKPIVRVRDVNEAVQVRHKRANRRRRASDTAGGVKASGYGRFGGQAAIAEFTDTRWVTIEDPHQHYPF